MDICLNGYSDYVSQAQAEQCESAAIASKLDSEAYPEVVQAGFLNLDKMPPFIPSSEKYDYTQPSCKFFAGLHATTMAAHGVIGSAIVDAWIRRSERQVTTDSATATTLVSMVFIMLAEVLRGVALLNLDISCQRPPQSPRGGTREVAYDDEADDDELRDMGEHKFVPIALMLMKLAQKLNQLNQAATEAVAGAASVASGALFVMPLNSSLLEFHNPDSDPI